MTIWVYIPINLQNIELKMYAFENDKSYLIRQKELMLFSEVISIEDGCQSWLLIVTTYIVLLITFRNNCF